LLSNDEFEIKKDLFVNSNPVIYGQEFIEIVELRYDLMFTDEQFAIIKDNFINNQYSFAKRSELYALQRDGILTEEEIRVKLSMLPNNPFNELSLLKIIPTGVLFGGFFYALSWVSN
jgi:hypothetical protein